MVAIDSCVFNAQRTVILTVFTLCFYSMMLSIYSVATILNNQHVVTHFPYTSIFRWTIPVIIYFWKDSRTMGLYTRPNQTYISGSQLNVLLFKISILSLLSTLSSRSYIERLKPFCFQKLFILFTYLVL